MKVIFVCTGNTCRSPMAEGFMKKIAADASDESMMVISRGIAASVGACASEYSVIAAMEHGADISAHVARQLTAEEIQEADIILTMTSSHSNVIRSAFPDYAGKTFPVSEYAQVADIADPYGCDLATYRACGTEIFEACMKIYNKLCGADK